MTLFAFATKGAVALEHRTSSTLTAIICFVAGCSYLVIRTYYHAMLETLVRTNDPVKRHNLLYASYLAISQYRYMDWTVTSPLLLVKNVLQLRVKPHQAPGALFCLATADLLMVFFGYIGEQQIDANGIMLRVRTTSGALFRVCFTWSFRSCFTGCTNASPSRRNPKSAGLIARWRLPP